MIKFSEERVIYNIKTNNKNMTYKKSKDTVMLNVGCRIRDNQHRKGRMQFRHILTEPSLNFKEKI